MLSGIYIFASLMKQVYLLLGSNEGDRREWLKSGLDEIALHCGAIIKASSVYETAAWGLEEQPAFLNMVVLIETRLSAPELLAEAQKAERKLGMPKQVKWGQRSLDIDILFYELETVNTPELIVPHPYMQERRFTLVPMAELAPDLVHPVFHKTISELLASCPDPLEVKKLQWEP